MQSSTSDVDIFKSEALHVATKCNIGSSMDSPHEKTAYLIKEKNKPALEERMQLLTSIFFLIRMNSYKIQSCINTDVKKP